MGKGRLDFKSADRFTTIALGFLYDPNDHRVTLTAPEERIDLFMRIEADPNTNKNDDKARCLSSPSCIAVN